MSKVEPTPEQMEAARKVIREDEVFNLIIDNKEIYATSIAQAIADAVEADRKTRQWSDYVDMVDDVSHRARLAERERCAEKVAKWLPCACSALPQDQTIKCVTCHMYEDIRKGDDE